MAGPTPAFWQQRFETGSTPWDRGEAGPQLQRGLKAEARACHIGRMEDIAAMGVHLQGTHGGLDILVNNAVLYLCAASGAFTTGASLVVDGGMSISML